MLVCVSSIGGEDFADLLEQVFGDNRLVLRLVTDTFVNDPTDVLSVGESVVDTATRVKISTDRLTRLGLVDFRTNSLTVELVGNLLARLELHCQLKDAVHQFGFVIVNGVSPIDNIEPQFRLAPDVLALSGRE